MKHTEDATSPVVGTIILVAITIILAAIVAAMVFGLPGTQQKEHNIGFTSKLDNGNIVVMVNSADTDALGLLDHINVKIDGVDVADWKPSKVSDSITYNGGFSKGTKIRMYGYFYPNGQVQPLYDGTV